MTSQVVAVCVVCRLCWIVGSAGITSDCSSAYAITPEIRTANVT